MIHLKTVFDGYWKTRQSDVSVKDRQAEYEKERKKMFDDYQKANEEYRHLGGSAGDPAISGEERDRRKKTAESKVVEIKEIEEKVQQYDRPFRAQITDQIKRTRDDIMREIRASLAQMRANVVAAGAGSIGLTLYPVYPIGAFRNSSMVPWGCQNGGDWCWFGGRMVQQLVRHGFVEEAYRELKLMSSRARAPACSTQWRTPKAGAPGGRPSAGVGSP